MKKKLLVLFTIFNLTLLGAESTKKDLKDLSITIYNDNFGLVKEKRKINLKNGDSKLLFKDVSNKVEIDSVMVDGIDVDSINYEYNMINRWNLLKDYVGKDIYFYNKDKDSKTKYRLLSINDSVILEDLKTGEVLINPDGKIILPKLNNNLSQTPLLSLQTNGNRVNKMITLSYLTKGLSWKANYVAKLKNNRLNLDSWISFNNDTGIDYENAVIKLFAGDVKRVVNNNYYGRSKLLNKSIAYESQAYEPKERVFEDYHLYDLNKRVTIKSNENKKIKLFSTKNVPYKKYYEYLANSGNRSVQSVIEIKNDKKNSLGIPLPKGVVKLYKEDQKDKALEFIGEDNISHTPKNVELTLKTGNSFDIIGKTKQLDRRKIATNIWQMEQEITLENNKDNSVEIRVEFPVYGDVKVVKTNHEYKIENNKILFKIKIDKTSKKVIKFKYNQKY